VKAPPSSYLLPYIYQSVSTSIEKLGARARREARDLYEGGEIDRGEYKRLMIEQIPEAFYNIHEASLDEFEKKYKVL
jgi:hypothetical protein